MAKRHRLWKIQAKHKLLWYWLERGGFHVILITHYFLKNGFIFCDNDERGGGFLFLKDMCVYCWCLCKHRAESCVPSLCNSLGAGFVVLKHCAKADISILVLVGLQLDELRGMCPDFMLSIRVKQFILVLQSLILVSVYMIKNISYLVMICNTGFVLRFSFVMIVPERL